MVSYIKRILSSKRDTPRTSDSEKKPDLPHLVPEDCFSPWEQVVITKKMDSDGDRVHTQVQV